MPPNHRDTTVTTELLLPDIGRDEPLAGPAPSNERVASHLVSRAARRLEIVCIATFVSTFLLWLVVNFARGDLANEFRALYQWLPPAAILASSATMFAAVRSRRFSPSTLVRLGLVYEVVISFAMTCASSLGAFTGMAASDFNADRVGLSYVALWTLFFTVLVPARPREALVALVASSSAVPLVYLLQVRAGAAPQLGLDPFLPIFVLPYAMGVVLAYIAARIVHRLGVEVRRAHELGSYRLDALLGRGGMGEVWRASHRTLARPAAIKLIRRDALAADATLAEVAEARFEREAQVIASLQSPHTVELYDFGTTEDGMLYYVMELLDGVDLDALVRNFGPLPPDRVVHLLRQACASLAEAHQRGVVHRDIKPANIYLCRRGIEHDVVKVLDFGLVKQFAREDYADAGAARVALTHANVVAGTPHYMAPEMALGERSIDGRADIYALGCVAFWLLTGRVVFEAETSTAAIVAHVRQEPRPPSAASDMSIPASLDRIVLDCLAKDPAARPQTPEQLAARLADVPLARAWTEADAARWWAAHQPAAASGAPAPMSRG